MRLHGMPEGPQDRVIRPRRLRQPPRRVARRAVALSLLAVFCALAVQAATCPANGAPLPTAAERQATVPIVLLRCFLPADEIDVLVACIGHDPQSASTDPLYESGKLNPDGTLRPPLTGPEIAALTDMHAVLDEDMRAGAILRKVVANSDVGGILFGQTVISTSGGLLVVATNTVRGFVGLERNTLGLDAGQTIATLGLDYETTPLGQFTDESSPPPHRLVSRQVQEHGLHSIRHVMSAQGAAAAQIPLGQNLEEAIAQSLPGRSFVMNRAGQSNPYTALGISDDIGLRKLDDPEADYPPLLNEEDVMTTPTPLAIGDTLLRRGLDGDETLIAVYAQAASGDGTATSAVWQLSPALSADDTAYYDLLIARAAAQVAIVANR
jgi:hypothetical protein